MNTLPGRCKTCDVRVYLIFRNTGGRGPRLGTPSKARWVTADGTVHQHPEQVDAAHR